MRILFITDESKEISAEFFCLAGKNHVKNFHLSILVLNKASKNARQAAHESGIAMTELHMHSPWNLFKAYGIYSCVSEYKPDVIHTFTHSPVFLLQLPRFKHLKVVYSPSIAHPDEISKFSRLLIQMQAEAFSQIILPSDDVCEEFRKHYPALAPICTTAAPVIDNA